MNSSRILWTIICLSIVYSASCLFAAGPIGRYKPNLAALFRPPLFNFSHKYEDGEVIGFKIGGPIDDVITTAIREGFLVEFACWGDQSALSLRKPSKDFISMAEGHGFICLSRDKLFIEIEIANGLVKSANLTFGGLDVVM